MEQYYNFGPVEAEEHFADSRRPGPEPIRDMQLKSLVKPLPLPAEFPALEIVRQDSSDARLPASDRYVSTAASGDKPEQHKITSRYFSIGYKFDITGENGEKEGSIEEKVISLTTTFNYKDKDGKLVATGTKRLFSWGTRIDVKDADGNPLGSIKEHVFSSILKPYSYYSILDKDGKEIASSEKLQLLATNFTLKDNAGREVATIHRGAFQLFTDKWDISIKNSHVVPKSLLYMIPAYKTTADGRSR